MNLDDLCSAFGIATPTGTDKSFIQSFIQKVRGTLPVQATLLQADGSTPPLINGVWYVTESDRYDCTYTLSFHIGAGESTGPMANAISWLSTELGLSLKPFTLDKDFQIPITLTKIIAYPADYQKGASPLSSTYQLAYQFNVNAFTLSIDFTETNVSVLLTPMSSTTSKDTSISSLLSQITASAPQSDLPGDDNSLFASFFSHFYLWNVRLSRSLSGASTGLKWGVSLLAAWKLGSDSSGSAQPIVVALNYDSDTSTFLGQLMFQPDLPGPMQKRLPLYDRRLQLPKAVYDDLEVDTLDDYLDLWKLFKQQGKPPPIPTKVTQAQITYQSTGDPKKVKTSVVTFKTRIAGDAQPVAGNDASAAPLGGLSWNDVSLQVQHSTSKDMSSGTPASDIKTNIVLSSNFTLAPLDSNSKFSPATLGLSLAYSSSNSSSTGTLSAWTLTGHMEDLSVGLLASFFHNDCSTGAMAVLGNLTLASLDLYCLYGSQSSTSTTTSASSFLISGVLKLGDLELDLSYQYVSSTAAAVGTTAAKAKWDAAGEAPKNVTVLTAPPTGKTYAYSFEAYPRVAGNSTIGSIAESIVPGSGSSIPDFVADIAVSLNDPTNTPVKLRYRGDQNGSALVVYVAIDMVNLTFVQLRTKEDPTTKAAAVKRILRISVDKIPMMEDIPLVKELPQPFDHLIYLWAQDDSTGIGTDKGFTRDEIESSGSADIVTINGELQDLKIPVIQRKEKPTPQPKDLELQDGHHFMIVTDGKVILDHVFGASNKDPNPPAKTETQDAGAHNSGPQVSTSDEVVPPTKGKTTTKAGSLSLTALSIQFKDGQLHIGIDATLMLGPLSLSVVGFVISIVMNDPKYPFRLNNLLHIVENGLVSATIHGVDISFEKEPLTIAGGFEHNIVTANGQTEEYYRGGVCVGLKAWKLLAIGQYSIVAVTKPDSAKYESVFSESSFCLSYMKYGLILQLVYGKLDGPLIELEFATISGVRLGFGYNSGTFDVPKLLMKALVCDFGILRCPAATTSACNSHSCASWLPIY